MSKLPEDAPGVTFWSHDDGDGDLQHEDIDDAIEAYLDALAPSPPAKTLEEFWESIPDDVTVYGYARNKLDDALRAALAAHALSYLIEWIEDDHGGGNEPSLVATTEMKVAARTFVDSVLAGYEPWRCELVCERTIDAHAWVREHAAGWFEDLPEAAEDTEV